MTQRLLWIPLALLALGLVLAGCPDQFSIPDRDDDDDDSAGDDDAADDDAGDDDSGPQGPTPAEVQDHLDSLASWPVVGGCGTVTVYAVSPGDEVEVKFDANIDFANLSLPHTEDFDLPGPGAALSVKAGFDMGSGTCGGGGSPETTDNYSIQGGSVTLLLAPGTSVMATVTFHDIEAKRVGGEEIVSLPDVSIGPVAVGN